MMLAGASYIAPTVETLMAAPADDSRHSAHQLGANASFEFQAVPGMPSLNYLNEADAHNKDDSVDSIIILAIIQLLMIEAEQENSAFQDL